MSTRPNRKVVKYERHYHIIVKGQTDTNMPEETPFGLETADGMIKMIVQGLDTQFKNRSVTLEIVDEKGGK